MLKFKAAKAKISRFLVSKSILSCIVASHNSHNSAQEHFLTKDIAHLFSQAGYFCDKFLVTYYALKKELYYYTCHSKAKLDVVVVSFFSCAKDAFK